MGLYKKPKSATYTKKIPKSFLTRKYEEFKERQATNRVIKRKVREEQYRAKLSEGKREVRQRERIKTDARLSRYKESKKSGTFGGFAGPTTKGGAGLGLGDALLGGSNGKKKKRPAAFDDMRLF